jgi:hypothetical protein
MSPLPIDVQWAGSHSGPTEAEPLLNGQVSEQRLSGEAASEGHAQVDHAIIPTVSSQTLPAQHASLNSIRLRVATAMFAFLVMGVIQSSIGVSAPMSPLIMSC